MRYIALVAALFLAAPLVAKDKEEGEKSKSGVPKGTAVPAFQVLDVTGPSAGKQLCYV